MSTRVREGHLYPWLALLLVNQVAVGMGLAISSLATFFRSRELANFILPLAMLAQIVFGVQVVGKGSGSLHEEYGRLHWGSCHGRDGCREPVAYWVPAWGGSLCHDCHATFQECEYDVKLELKAKGDRTKPPQTSLSRLESLPPDLVRTRAKKRFKEESETRLANNSAEPTSPNVRPPPSRMAIVASYFTISR